MPAGGDGAYGAASGEVHGEVEVDDLQHGVVGAAAFRVHTKSALSRGVEAFWTPLRLI